MENSIINSQVSPRLLRIANTILCNYNMVYDTSLLDGKMGVCLFLYEYARHSGIKEYEDIADEMIDLVLKILHKGQSEDNISRLSGIGIGVIYLITHQFLEDTDEHDSLKELDKFLLKTIETAMVPSEKVIHSALYFIYRFKYYRMGLDKRYCHKMAGKLIDLSRAYEDTSEKESKMWTYILHNATLIHNATQRTGNLHYEDNAVSHEIEQINNQNQITAEGMWYSFFFCAESCKISVDDDALFYLCQNCFYDAERTIGILCSYGLMEMNHINYTS